MVSVMCGNISRREVIPVRQLPFVAYQKVGTRASHLRSEGKLLAVEDKCSSVFINHMVSVVTCVEHICNSASIGIKRSDHIILVLTCAAVITNDMGILSLDGTSERLQIICDVHVILFESLDGDEHLSFNFDSLLVVVLAEALLRVIELIDAFVEVSIGQDSSVDVLVVWLHVPRVVEVFDVRISACIWLL